jgi:putative PIN family toxin of toxin-antitoxin system
MNKTVIDANLYFSAFLKGGKPEAVIRRAAKELDTLFITDDIIKEIRRILHNPILKLTPKQIDFIIADLEEYGHKITIQPHHKAAPDACRDPEDIKYLECADAAKADYIVSGDNDLLDMIEYKGIKIVKANAYLEIVEGDPK